MRRENRVRNVALYVVVGINLEGYKELLGFWINERENASYWVSVPNNLKSRGVEDIITVIAYNLRGVEEAIRSVYLVAEYQQCIVHKVRSSLRKDRYGERKQVRRDLRAIYTQSTEDMARQKFEEFKDKWGSKYLQVVEEWERDWEVIMTFCRYPYLERECSQQGRRR